MIELNLHEVLESVEALKMLASRSFPARVAFQIARLSREVQKENDLFEQQRNELIKKYCSYDENGNVKYNEQHYIEFEPDKWPLFENELNALLNTTVQLNVEPIDLQELGDMQFSPEQMMKIMPLLR